MNADTTNYTQRVAAGRSVERHIISQLRAQGVNLLDATDREDMYDKIDVWMLGENGIKHSLQIKYREGGDDILVEIIKDIDMNIPGRDMQSKAEFYLIVNRSGEGRLFETKDIKQLAQNLLEYFESVKSSTTNDRWKNTGWELKVTRDRAHGNRKLMGYFVPAFFKVSKLWNKLLMLL